MTSALLPTDPDRLAPQILRLMTPGPNRGALVEIIRLATGASISDVAAVLKAGHGELARGRWSEMYELAKRCEKIGAQVEIVKLRETTISKDQEHNSESN